MDLIDGSFIEITNYPEGKGRIFMVTALNKHTFDTYVKHGCGQIFKEYKSYSVFDPMIKNSGCEYVLKGGKLVRIHLDGVNNRVCYHPNDKMELEYKIVYQPICIEGRSDLLELDAMHNEAKLTIKKFIDFHGIKGENIEATLYGYFNSVLNKEMQPTLYMNSKYDGESKYYLSMVEYEDKIYLHILPESR